MRLYLVRHGVAEDHTAAHDDAQRALTPQGKAKMAAASRGLRKLKMRPDLILTSPLRRAYETAAILAQELGGIKLEELAQLAGSSTPGEVLSALRAYRNLTEVALVGHQPGMGHLASLMLTGSINGCEIEFKKGAVACFDQDRGEKPNRYTLIWSLPPKVLRSL